MHYDSENAPSLQDAPSLEAAEYHEKYLHREIGKLCETFGVDAVVRASIEAKIQTGCGLSARELGINPRALRTNIKSLKVKK